MGATKPTVLSDKSPNRLPTVQHGVLVKPQVVSKGKGVNRTNSRHGKSVANRDRISGVERQVEGPCSPPVTHVDEETHPPLDGSSSVEGFLYDGPQASPPPDPFHLSEQPRYPTPSAAGISRPITPPQAQYKCQNSGSHLATEVVYAMRRRISGYNVDEENEVLGVFDDIEAAKEAAPRLLGQGYFEEEEPDYETKCGEDGRISLHAEDEEFMFDLDIQKTTLHRVNPRR